ncbi:hypothetical protein GCM10029992_45450 [Glycomyces albus]
MRYGAQMSDSQDLSELADQHLPPQIAAQWKALLKPAVQFDWAAGSDVVVAQLGGDPEMPPGEPWPEWEDYGPLSFIASVDCAGFRIDGLPLPESGRLLFFFSTARSTAARSSSVCSNPARSKAPGSSTSPRVPRACAARRPSR